MPCHVDELEMTHEKHLELMLCKACKFLTPEQINSLRVQSGYVDGTQWYLEHLLHDYAENIDKPDEFKFFGLTSAQEVEIAQSEANRLGHVLGKGEYGSVSLSPIKIE